MTGELACWRWHGLGNDYVIFESGDVQQFDPSLLAQAACDRHTGLGGDGIIMLTTSAALQSQFSIYNADGSVAELCGNGLRCAAALLSMKHGDRPDVSIQSAVAQHDLRVERVSNRHWRVGGPLCQAVDHGAFDVQVGSMLCRAHHVVVGNPHAVVFLDAHPSDELLRTAFDAMQCLARFERGVNVHLAVVESSGAIRMRTWERGAGPTQACATGAAATAAAAQIDGRVDGDAIVYLPGGELHVDATNLDGPVQVTGDVELIASMQWCVSIDP